MPFSRNVHILIADDDVDDCLLIKDAFESSKIGNSINFVHDGEQLVRYLRRMQPYDDSVNHPMPGLILLDLNMPLKDGREALTEIKADEKLRSIPIIILTTSSSEEDVANSYADGVNSFITKPVTFTGLQNVVKGILRYWLEIVELPD
ncbi:response regulator [Acidovorax delafieldii]|uniref:response regulator n=1 Tax=Acidovorax delafieldii TaxID=47920 RepID=UPI003ECCEC0C